VKGLILIRKPDLNEFWFYSVKTGEFRFRIVKPILADINTRKIIDTKGRVIIDHKMEFQSDGSYLYTKEGDLREWANIPDEFLVDADTVYSLTSDGFVVKQNANWTTCRSATSGDTANNTGDLYVGVSKATNYSIWRGFLYYDLSSFSGTGICSAASEHVYSESNLGSTNIITMKGTQARPLTTADFDSFDVTKLYSSAQTPALQNEHVYFVYNSTGLSAVEANIGGTHYTCLRQNSNDVSNSVPPSSSNYEMQLVETETAGTSFDPCLDFKRSLVKKIGGIEKDYVRSIIGEETESVRQVSNLGW
jgi:hypothetical protein